MNAARLRVGPEVVFPVAANSTSRRRRVDGRRVVAGRILVGLRPRGQHLRPIDTSLARRDDADSGRVKVVVVIVMMPLVVMMLLIASLGPTDQ